ncbi:MAG TPA: RagB/SusD family nutrient uptake outer membrane protein, partial [Prolixibacteraceae bacterium]|nr:RagB/SusD family nutrient uptake outer membrane protein [Prolixibacteraceae bacterium]
MKHKILFIIGFLSMIFAGCESFLDKPPLDQMTEDTYFTNEENLRTFSYGFYERDFDAYGSGYTWGSYFVGQSLNDEFAPTTPTAFLKTVPTSASGTVWNFTYVRKANLMIENIRTTPISDEAKKHWTGIARFFRALEYARLISTYGDVPWINKVPLEDDNEVLYRPRDPRAMVVDSMLADFDYAALNVRAADGTKGLSVNKYVVLAFMSRVMLYEGTMFKYHAIDPAKATTYLGKAKWAANEVITKGGYTLHTN